MVGRRRRDGGFELVDKLFKSITELLGLASEGGCGTLQVGERGRERERERERERQIDRQTDREREEGELIHDKEGGRILCIT